MAHQIARIYEETRNWGRGPLDATERAAAIAICDRAASLAEAVELLAMCGLLREGGK